MPHPTSWATVLENRGLVGFTIQRFMRERPDDPELVESLDGVGVDALYKAAETFDPNRGTTFATYASAIMWRDFADEATYMQSQRGEQPKSGATAETRRFQAEFPSDAQEPDAGVPGLDRAAGWLIAAGLTRDEARVIELVDLGGHSLHHAAEITGRSRGWIRARLDQGREKVRRVILPDAGGGTGAELPNAA